MGRSLVVGAVVAAVAGSVLAAPASAAAPEVALRDGQTYSAVIQRTEYGVPHITGASMASAGYGFGYAFAQDNLCLLAEHVTTLAGERSRHFGPEGRFNNGPGTFTNLESDLYFRAFNDSGRLEQLLAAKSGPSLEIRETLRGYVAGFNRYLRTTGVDRLPDPTCRGKAWVRPLTELDLWRNLHDSSQLTGVSSFTSQIANAKPPTSKGIPAIPASAEMMAVGSNAWGLGREATRDGSGLLLGNPHFPWAGPNRLYQAQLTVPGKLNVLGAALAGLPTIAIGHNESMAWTHTVSSAHRFTMFELKLAPGDPTSYVVDGKTEPMSKRTVRVQVRGADGSLSTVERVLYRSRYGPVLADGWTDTMAFAVRGSNEDSLRAMDQELAVGRAKDVTEVRDALHRVQGSAFTNTVAADAKGQSFYADASVVPHVTDAHAQRCVDTPAGRAFYPARVILNGSRLECGWGSDPDAVTPGVFGPKHQPAQQRADYVQNANESAWLTNAFAPLTGYPRMYGPQADPRSPRDRLSHLMVDQRRAGSDGLGAPGFDLPNLQQAMLGNRTLTGELFRDAVVGLIEANPTMTATDGARIDVRTAGAVLAKWDGRMDTDSPGAVLWREVYGGIRPLPNKFVVPFDPKDPVRTPHTLNTAEPKVRTAIADGVQRLLRNNLPLELELGKAQRDAPSRKLLPIQGCAGSEGCFNVTEPSTTKIQADGTYGKVEMGSSFIMAVQLGRNGPRSQSVLTYSQSANPASPHHYDQTELYVRKGWVPGRYTQTEIRKAPGLTTDIIAE
ncbi:MULTISPECIES: penicillin acylase family protein [unclassified Crossiella]|uniref:penicillin acylase family protein n=1 Tax=unclassified Crossiella TaxID=2620835 RepID=UPI001FFEE8AA|nr:MULTISPECIES: penicillin acylase family protein [unclassified Crossiella]MCK2237631.1 penicillin acylase family protein [Crossiella sp. S99.2]MCK2254917.1 penicillin acylase family protein [Crossiella sp. S99.1]